MITRGSNQICGITFLAAKGLGLRNMLHLIPRNKCVPKHGLLEVMSGYFLLYTGFVLVHVEWGTASNFKKQYIYIY